MKGGPYVLVIQKLHLKCTRKNLERQLKHRNLWPDFVVSPRKNRLTPVDMVNHSLPIFVVAPLKYDRFTHERHQEQANRKQYLG